MDEQRDFATRQLRPEDQETIMGMRPDTLMATLREMVDSARERNDPTLSIALSVDAVAFLLDREAATAAVPLDQERLAKALKAQMPMSDGAAHEGARRIAAAYASADEDIALSALTAAHAALHLSADCTCAARAASEEGTE